MDFPVPLHADQLKEQQQANCKFVGRSALRVRVDRQRIAAIRGDTPCIKVLSKSDLADPDVTAMWQAHLEQERRVKTFTTTTEQPQKMKQIIDLCRKMLPEKDASIKTINTMICGIPNVGKSTLINILAERIIAKTGNEPAVTKTRAPKCLASWIAVVPIPDDPPWIKMRSPGCSPPR